MDDNDMLEFGKAMAGFAKHFSEQHSGFRDALLYLAVALAKQSGINAQVLADDFSELIEMHHSPENTVPISLLDMRAALYQAAQRKMT